MSSNTITTSFLFLLFVCFNHATPVTVSQTVWIDPQNNARTSYGLSPFIYDDDLVYVAQQYTEKCVDMMPDRTQIQTDYATRKLQSYDGSASQSLGMNLGVATPGYSSPSWLTQKDNWTCTTNACSAVCGGWTQVIWEESVKMGCAISRCTSGSPFSGFSTWELSLCLYSISGNMQGEHPFGNELWRCSTTPTPTPVAVVSTPTTTPPSSPTTIITTTTTPSPNTPSGSTTNIPSGSTTNTPSGSTTNIPSSTTNTPSGSTNTPSSSESTNSNNESSGSSNELPAWAIALIVIGFVMVVGVVIVVVFVVVTGATSEVA